MATVTVTTHSTRINGGPARTIRGASMAMVVLLDQFDKTIAAQAVPADADLRNVSFPNLSATVHAVMVTTSEAVFTERFPNPYTVQNGTFTVDISLEVRF